MANDIIQKKTEELNAAMRQFPIVARDLGVQFFKSRFRAQGWLDRSFQPWKKRKKVDKRRPGRGILMSRGRLVNSITGTVNGPDVTFRSDTPYSKIHNEGGTINHPGGERAMAFRTFKKGKNAGKTLFHRNNETAHFARKVNVGSYQINMPKRQFMGDSAHLRKIIERKLTTTISKVFNS